MCSSVGSYGTCLAGLEGVSFETARCRRVLLWHALAGDLPPLATNESRSLPPSASPPSSSIHPGDRILNAPIFNCGSVSCFIDEIGRRAFYHRLSYHRHRVLLPEPSAFGLCAGCGQLVLLSRVSRSWAMMNWSSISQFLERAPLHFPLAFFELLHIVDFRRAVAEKADRPTRRPLVVFVLVGFSFSSASAF